MVSLPLTILNSPAVSDLADGGSNPSFGTARDIVGIILWGLGWLIESTADIQKVCSKYFFLRSDANFLRSFVTSPHSLPRTDLSQQVSPLLYRRFLLIFIIGWTLGVVPPSTIFWRVSYYNYHPCFPSLPINSSLGCSVGGAFGHFAFLQQRTGLYLVQRELLSMVPLYHLCSPSCMCFLVDREHELITDLWYLWLRILMFASGVPTAEKPTAKKFFLLSNAPSTDSTSSSPPRSTYPDAWQKYKAYLNSTSILIPVPPVVYRPLPMYIKRTILFDWGIYRFDEATDGKAALKEAQK